MRSSQALFSIILFVSFAVARPLFAQVPSTFPDGEAEPKSAVPQQPDGSAQDPSQSSGSSDKRSKVDSPQPKIQPDDQSGQQTKRILGIIPNYKSVSANTYLPPLAVKEKLWLATQDSFDYSAFVYTGLLAGAAMAQKSEPSFGQGASGYGNYFAHTFADNTVENYMVEAVVPAATKQDPRYYTLGKGGFFKRSGYAFSRLFITRMDSGNRMFNFSEVIGAGAAAGISQTYYPSDENKLVKTYQRWISEVIQDGVSNLVKEFWPDINHAVFHSK